MYHYKNVVSEIDEKKNILKPLHSPSTQLMGLKYFHFYLYTYISDKYLLSINIKIYIDIYKGKTQ